MDKIQSESGTIPLDFGCTGQILVNLDGILLPESDDDARHCRIPAGQCQISGPAEFRHVLQEFGGGQGHQNLAIRYQNLKTFSGRFGLPTNFNTRW